MLRRILSRIRASTPIRDTDQDWEIIGKTEPYFGVLTSERFKRACLDDRARTEFFQSGKDEVSHFLNRLQKEFGDFSPRSALDFGCGVGRLTRPLVELTGHAVGVDISPGMLVEARKHACPGLSFTNMLPDGQFDWVVSNIVLQHIPPERGYIIIKDLLGRVAPKGGVTLQVMLGRIADQEYSAGARMVIGADDVWLARSRRKPHKIPDGIMIMHDYDISHVVALFYLFGIHDLFLEYCNHGGIIGATIYGRRE